MKMVRYAVWGILGLAFVGCGSDGGSGVGGSYASIVAGIESPTGTVDETTAVDVAEQFEATQQGSSVAPFGRRDIIAPAGAGSQSLPCDGGGNISVTSSGNASAGNGSFTYNSCCVAAGCCLNGSGNVFVSGEQTGAEYQICIDYDVSFVCDGQSASIDSAGCIGANGYIFVIQVDGETFAVSGSYSGGNGTLEISGSNGSFTCTYSGGTGSCTGSSGEFSF